MSIKRFHIALGVANIEESVKDYSTRLAQSPDIIIPNEYALWRTPTLNFSIRTVSKAERGHLRHLGWELSDATQFLTEIDSNGIPWESFTAAQQDEEIKDTWTDSPEAHKP